VADCFPKAPGSKRDQSQALNERESMRMKKYVMGLFIFLFSLNGFCLASENAVPPGASAELSKMFMEDQSSRNIAPGAHIDGDALRSLDAQHQKRVKELLSLGPFENGIDYYHAAMILQHGLTPDDYLLAHDLCVVAISKGENKARWLAAASEDRFLLGIGRAQRFGTQFQAANVSVAPHLAPVDPDVTDAMRLELNVSSLAQTKKNEIDFVNSYNEQKKIEASK